MDDIGWKIAAVVLVTFLALARFVGRRGIAQDRSDPMSPLRGPGGLEIAATVAFVLIGIWAIDFFDLDTGSTRVLVGGAALSAIVLLLIVRVWRGSGAGRANSDETQSDG